MTWENTYQQDFGGIAVVAAHNGGQLSVRIVKPYVDKNGERSLNVSGRIGGMSINVPRDADPNDYGPLAEIITEALASLPKPEPKASKASKVKTHQADPQVLAALAGNPEALKLYLTSLK
jgi:hypothetical protein